VNGNQWCVVSVLMVLAATAVAQDAVPELQFEKYTLENGLDVILHEDHSIPMVAVNIWYHVGSKNERPGRTGFAHLFEHMMFQGSENHDADYFLPLQKIGAQVNGSTNKDRTNYWENVPSDQVALALWLEADRMAGLVPAMTQEKLDNQRDVVKNEKRQGDNQPYAKADEILLEMMFSPDHPYGHTVIGSMEDLSAASQEDVAAFFEQYYTPNNASLCVAGDFEPAVVKDLIERYFGTIPAGRPVDRFTRWIPRLEGERRAQAEDTVELPRLYMSWHTPGWYQAGDAEFDLLGSILAGGKNSRLHRTLVYEQQIAQDVRAHQDSRELGGNFVIEVTAAPGHGLAEIEAAVDRELDNLREKGVKKDELEMARIRFEAGFVRRLQRSGGFGGKADRLNRYNTYTGDPGYLPRDLERFRRVSTSDLTYYIRSYLERNRRAVLHVVPQGTLTAVDDSTARAVQPASSGEVAFDPPVIQTTTLDNGLRILLVEKHDLPLVEVRLSVLSGWSADPEDKPGTAGVTADMLDEGAAGRDALEIANAAERLGAELRTSSFFDGSVVTLNVLGAKLDAGLELMADVALRPDFKPAEFERVRRNYLGRHRQEAVSPMVQAIKELQVRSFGAGHPYAQPYTGTGSAEALERLTVENLRTFHSTWYRPGNATLVVVGDLDLAAARRSLEEVFGQWEAADVPAIAVPDPAPVAGARIVLIDRPGAEQSIIVGGYASLDRSDPDYEVFLTLNTAFGGQFSSRINMNLREEKGYTYGARSQLAAFRAAGLFLVTAPVHTRYTSESLVELLAELEGISGANPLTVSERDDSCNRRIMGFPGRFETWRGIAHRMETLVLNDLPLDGWAAFEPTIRSLTVDDLAACARAHLEPGRMTWIVVGDREAVEEGLRGLGWGEVEVVSAGP